MAKILIAYGTGEGQTAKISEYVARVIVNHGHDAEAVDVRDLPGEVSVEEHEAVIVGASIHAGRHEDYVRDFVLNNREVLERLPSTFFSVSMTARTETEDSRKQVEEYVEGFARETGWHPERVGVFAGALPYRQYGFVKKRLVGMIAKRMGADADISRDFEYTDWEAVRSFAEAFIKDLP